jgi:hypothetical protein
MQRTKDPVWAHFTEIEEQYQSELTGPTKIRNKCKCEFGCAPFVFRNVDQLFNHLASLSDFLYLWLTIQNTAIRQVRNLFWLLAVFNSFPLARFLPPAHPAPLFGGEGKYQKKQKNKIVGVGDVAVAFCFCFSLLDRS